MSQSISPASLTALVMDYAHEKPPRWARIRQEVAGFFETTLPTHTTYRGLQKPGNVRLNPIEEVFRVVFNQPKDVRHRIIYQSPLVGDPQDALFTLMGEHHKSGACRDLNAIAIDGTVKEDSVLLIEGVSQSRWGENQLTGTTRNKRLEVLRISKYAQHVLQVCGWDFFDHFPQEESLKDEAPFYSKSDSAEALVCEFCLVDDSLQEHTQLIEDFKRDKFLSAQDKTLTVQAITQSKVNIENRREALWRQIEDLFPDRTEAMVKALQNVHRLHLQGSFRGRVYCLGGLSHFEQQPENEKDPRYSLDKLYDLLRTLPVVVLCPMDTSTMTWG